MKRGFEENVPRVRPRVRMGRPFDEPGDGPDASTVDPVTETPESQLELAAAPIVESQPPPRRSEPDPQPPLRRPDAATEPLPAVTRSEGVAELIRAVEVPRKATEARPPEAAQRAPRRSVSPAAEVAQLAKDLTAELAQAAEANAQLRADLDAAVTALRRAAEESREQRLESDRLAAEVDRRAAAVEQLKREMQLLEAERDGALGQVGRLVRELRDEKARAANAVREAEAAQAEAAQAREHAQRLTSEVQARAAERDQARAAANAIAADRDALSEALLAARAEADEAVQSRAALEEIHRALDEARSRVAHLR